MYIIHFPTLPSTVFSKLIVEGPAVSDVLLRFGKKMRMVRKKKGVSQEKLADLAGLHRTYVSLVDRGECNISLINIEKIANALEVSLAKLMPN